MQIPIVATAGLLTAATLTGLHDPAAPTWQFPLDITCGVLGCLLVAVLFRRPLPTAVVLAAMAALSPAVTPASTMATNQVAHVRPFRSALLAAAAGAVGHLIQGLWRPIPGMSLLWWIVLDVAVHAALLGWGQWSQARRQLIWSLKERASRAESEQARKVAEARVLERTRIAREMHDVLAHRLSLLATYAGALEYRPDSSPDRLAQAASVIRSGAHKALDELREVIGVLRDDDVSSPDVDRPQPTVEDLDQLVAESRAAGVGIDFVNSATVAAVPPTIGRTVYRVVQEGLTNARKHASGQRVRIRIDGEPGKALVVEIGNQLRTGSASTPGTGFGLVGLTERVQLLGGRLEYGTTDSRFTLRASLPWPA